MEFGRVGQTFGYGAKGGDIYIQRTTAGRPLICAVGGVRAVVNEICLEYAAESFMAGSEKKSKDKIEGVEQRLGFIIINGFAFNPQGELVRVEEVYPGSNFFSLAGGGLGFINDPFHTVLDEQIRGAEFAELTDEDWAMMLPHLKRNEELFGIGIDTLLTVDGHVLTPHEVYRKVRPIGKALTERGE